MNDTDWNILDELYLLNDFNSLRDTLHMDEQSLGEALSRMVEKGWVRQLIYNPDRQEYEDITEPDLIPKSHFVISKNGLIEHTRS